MIWKGEQKGFGDWVKSSSKVATGGPVSESSIIFDCDNQSKVQSKPGQTLLSVWWMFHCNAVHNFSLWNICCTLNVFHESRIFRHMWLIISMLCSSYYRRWRHGPFLSVQWEPVGIHRWGDPFQVCFGCSRSLSCHLGGREGLPLIGIFSCSALLCSALLLRTAGDAMIFCLRVSIPKQPSMDFPSDANEIMCIGWLMDSRKAWTWCKSFHLQQNHQKWDLQPNQNELTTFWTLLLP